MGDGWTLCGCEFSKRFGINYLKMKRQMCKIAMKNGERFSRITGPVLEVKIRVICAAMKSLNIARDFIA